MGDRECNINESIECTVRECRHHSKEANYCSLNTILVSAQNSVATEKQNTDCMSFDAKVDI